LVNVPPQGDSLRRNLLARYFGKPAPKKTSASGGHHHSTPTAPSSGAGHPTPAVPPPPPLATSLVRTPATAVAAHGPGGRLLSRAEMTLHEVQGNLS